MPQNKRKLAGQDASYLLTLVSWPMVQKFAKLLQPDLYNAIDILAPWEKVATAMEARSVSLGDASAQNDLTAL